MKKVSFVSFVYMAASLFAANATFGSPEAAFVHPTCYVVVQSSLIDGRYHKYLMEKQMIPTRFRADSQSLVLTSQQKCYQTFAGESCAVWLNLYDTISRTKITTVVSDAVLRGFGAVDVVTALQRLPVCQRK